MAPPLLPQVGTCTLYRSTVVARMSVVGAPVTLWGPTLRCLHTVRSRDAVTKPRGGNCTRCLCYSTHSWLRRGRLSPAAWLWAGVAARLPVAITTHPGTLVRVVGTVQVCRVGPVFRGTSPSLLAGGRVRVWQHDPHAHDQLGAAPRTADRAVHVSLFRDRNPSAALRALLDDHDALSSTASGASGNLRRCAMCPVRNAVPPARIAGQ